MKSMGAASPVSLSKQQSIGIVVIDNPPVNAASQAVRQGILDAMIAAEGDSSIEAIVITCTGKTFIAGGDITEFDKPLQPPHLPDVLQKLDQCSKPTIAALFGTTLGGGLETALSCHYRIALQHTQLGLPEVTLGLIPGAGGTQLLPRLAGIDTALDMITSGKSVPAESMVECGLIDRIAESDLLREAITFAQELLNKGHNTRPVSAINLSKTADHNELFDSWRAKLAKKTRGQTAPQYCIDSLENSVLLPFCQGKIKEREMFLECRESSQSQAMRHVFFAERQAARLDNLSKDTATQIMDSIAVIGAGSMGTGIAMCFAEAGFPVVLLETNEYNLQNGLNRIRDNYLKSVNAGRITKQKMEYTLNAIRGTCEYQDIADVDLVAEAAFENMAVKLDIFKQLDSTCKKETILATNTSYLDINKIAKSTQRPEKVLGMHFFSPANIMKLLEVVRTDYTNDSTLKSAISVGKRIKKISTVVGSCYGFVGNRMYACYGREAQMLLLEGATPQQIDLAMENWGMAMGPFAVNDMSGIDIGYKARRENPNLPNDPRYFRPADIMVEAGRLGRKSNAGFYRYDAADERRQPDPVVADMIRAEAKKLGVSQRKNISNEEIQQRLIFALVNEGANILDEGIANRAGDIDVIWINGYGFPRHRGGPMYYANQLGLGNVLAGIKKFQQQCGNEYWQPSFLFESHSDSYPKPFMDTHTN